MLDSFLFSEPIVLLLSKWIRYVYLLQVLTLVFVIYKANLFKTLAISFRDNLKFLILLVVFSLTFSLSNQPLDTLVSYDEDVYLLQARNLATEGSSQVCISEISGDCKYLSIAPLGLGNSAFLSYFYTTDHFLRITIALINSCFLALSSVLLFLSIYLLYPKRNITKYVLSLLLVILPYNNAFSTTLMPEIPALFFVNIAVFLLVILKFRELSTSQEKMWLVFGIILSLMILSSLRVEFSIILYISLIFLIINIKFVKSIKWISFWPYLLLFAIFILVSLISFFFNLNKKLLIPGSKCTFGLEFVNLTYLSYHFSNLVLICISVLSLLTVFRTIVRKIKVPLLNKRFLFYNSLFLIYIFYVFFYSFYNYEGIYRFLIPLSGVLLILSSNSLNFFLSLTSSKYRIILALALCLFVSSILIPESFNLKSDLSDDNTWSREFIKFIQPSNLDYLVGDSNRTSHFYFVSAFIGSLVGLENYGIPETFFENNLSNESNLFYIDYYPSTYSESVFNTPKFNATLISDSKFKIYKIEIVSHKP